MLPELPARRATSRDERATRRDRDNPAPFWKEVKGHTSTLKGHFYSRRISIRLLLATVLALALGAGPLIAGGAGATTNSAADKAASAPRADFSGLVDIGGGRTMYMECRGKGGPTVVLVSSSATPPMSGA